MTAANDSAQILGQAMHAAPDRPLHARQNLLPEFTIAFPRSLMLYRSSEVSLLL
jgi:hypothetical protein